MKEFKVTILSAFIAGLFIGIAGWLNLCVGGLTGAVLFAFGLLSIVHYGVKLYTGTIGFCQWSEWKMVLTVLLGNLIGTFAVAMLARYTPNYQQFCDTAYTIFAKRMSLGYGTILFLSVACGFIMTTAVKFGREQLFLPLLFGVPVFILAGFPHSIADSFYYFCLPFETFTESFGHFVIVYLMTLLGNLIGCNLFRWTNWLAGK